MIRWAVPLAALFATGCDSERCDNGADDDGDGFVDCADQDCASECTEHCANDTDDDADGLVDCDDPDCADTCPTTPAGPEDCTNGVDDDLDAQIDCQDGDCRTTCDADADGFLAPEVGGTDCDDDDSDVHPGAVEVPYNGSDDDCDAITPDDDLDGDGFLLAEDCADTSAATYPGAPETCGNGLVDDCDAVVPPARDVCFIPRSLSTADGTFLSGTSGTFVGTAVALVPDCDQDGDADAVVGATGDGSSGNGSAMLVPSVPGLSELSDAPVKWIAPSEQDAAGTSVSYARGLAAGVGVFDSVFVGAPYADDIGLDSGAAYVVRSTIDPSDPPVVLDLAPPIPRFVGEAAGDTAGFAVSGGGNANGDASDDGVVGAPSAAGGLGVAYVAYGPVTATVSLSIVTERIVGDAVGDEAGCAVAFAGDPSGDGRTDVLVGACGAAGGAGRAALVTTHDGSERTMSEADAVWTGSAGDQLGAAVSGAGDIDGDGVDDLLIGLPGAGGGAGAAWLVRGPAAGPDPEAEIVGSAPGDAAGTVVRGVGDVDGDGVGDLAIGAPLSDEAGTDAGTAYVAFGPLSGVLDAASLPIRLTGSAAFDHAGAAIDGGLDADDDGYDDVLVGAPYHDGLAPSGGAVYLLTFGL